MPIRERAGKWYWRVSVNGHEYEQSTGLAATERNRNAALRQEAKARELILLGRSSELRLEVKPFNDAAEAFVTWADSEYRDHPNSAKRLRTSFASLADFFGRQPVAAVTRGKVKDYMAHRRTEHEVREVTLRHDLHALSKAYGYWIDHNWALTNPVQGVDMPSDKDAVRIHVLTPAEEALYFATAEKLSQPRSIARAANRRQRAHKEILETDYSDLIDVSRLMLEQGCRPGEVIALRVGDVDLEAGRLVIRDGKSNAAKRRLKLTAVSREVLARRISGGWGDDDIRDGVGESLYSTKGSKDKTVSGFQEVRRLPAEPSESAGTSRQKWIFPSSRVPGQHIAIPQRAHDRVCEAAGLSFVLYDLRHSAATRWAQSNVDPATIAKWLGHADLRTVQKYIHIEESHSDAMAKRAEEYRAGQAAPVEQRKERIQ